MAKLLLAAVCAALVVGITAGLVRRTRRRRADSTPGLHRHPERLDQMLDSTDDA